MRRDWSSRGVPTTTATVLGAVTGFFPIGWIVLNVIFLYRLTVEKGAFETLQNTIGGVTALGGVARAFGTAADADPPARTRIARKTARQFMGAEAVERPAKR